ncbi:MAG: RNA-binding S4 domain-containing protein [Prevotellaceae bacterium]|nr:RNA-binding S4 domain-containing protein [Prevotellaceae bacterium]
MSEFDEWQDKTPASEDSSDNGGSREGYRPSYNRENNYGGASRPSHNRGDRPQRPRFNRNDRAAYSSNGVQNERGYRPSAFSSPYYSSEEGGQQQRGGYQQRPYNNGGYNNHGGYNNRGGYQQRGYGNRGGYQPNGEQEGGYQRQGGYQPRQGGYQQHGGYNNRGGYQQGGYRQGGYQNRGGYQQGNRGYQQNGGYQNRGGYQRQRTADYNPNAKYSLKKQIEYKEYLEDPNAPIRLNRFLANAGVCSRREADQFIQAGVVSVNGKVVTELGSKVLRTDEVHFHDQLVSIEKKVYVILNKPKDYVTTSDDPQQRKTVMELVKNCCRERIYPVGRLDRNTTGVLLFTNDGDLASKLTHPKFLKKKIYHVFLDKNCTAADMKQIAEGITLEDGDIKADAISYASDTDRKQVGIEIHSGKNRIVRRIFESLGYKVLKLDRVMFAGLTKKGIKRGDWRFLTEQEVAMLHTGHYE